MGLPRYGYSCIFYRSFSLVIPILIEVTPPRTVEVRGFTMASLAVHICLPNVYQHCLFSHVPFVAKQYA